MNTNVPTHLPDADQLAFSQDSANFRNAGLTPTPEEEAVVIQKIQDIVLKWGPSIPDYSEREPVDVLKRDTGLCYHPSRLFDKHFISVGFEARHVHILYKPVIAGYTSPLWLTLFLPGTESHAVTEVWTS